MAGLLGVVLLARHGDRTLLPQDPFTYGTGHATLTPLGQAQELQLGNFLRSEYLTGGGSSRISRISRDIVDDREVLVIADNGSEGSVVLDSAQALLQGLFPPTSESRSKLANGTTVVGPFNGYQYLPIESVEPQQSFQLEGWTSCPSFEKHVKEFYDSALFKEKARESAPFLRDLEPFLYGRPNNLENAYNVYDFVNVNYIHNETFAFRLPPSYLEQAHALANFHEQGVFSDKQANGIGNVAGRTILPSIIQALERIANPRDPLALVIEEVSYKPFISLFNLTGIDDKYPHLKGIPDYGSVLAFELRNNEEGETYLRTKFKSGMEDAWQSLHLFDHKEDIALNEFVYRLDLSAIRTLPQWCRACGQSSQRGCAVCPTDAMSNFNNPLLGDGSASSGGVPMLGMMENWSFMALFAFLFLAFFGLFKVYKSRRDGGRVFGGLRGYERLPTTGNVQYQYSDREPIMQKIQRM